MTLRKTGAAFVLLGAIAGMVAAQPPRDIEFDLGGGVKIEFVRISAGNFTQGSREKESGRGDDETAREVTISSDYYIGRTEVTVGQFRRFVDETKYRTEAEKGTSGGFGWDGAKLSQRGDFNWKNPGFPQTDEHPVTIVTHADAVAFANWLAKKMGRAVTLPTEAQWEFAARVGAASAYPSATSGAKPGDLGWSKANAGNATHPVGGKEPNGAGLVDMAGNAAEWCLDWYGPYDPGNATDPVETRKDRSDQPRRVLRGGSWAREPIRGRSAARYRADPGSRNADTGFRVVATTGAAATSTSARPASVSAVESSNDSQGMAILLWILGSAVAVMIGIAALARRMMNGAFGNSHGVRTSVSDDGFSIHAPKVPSGHRIHYVYVVDGAPKTGDVIFAGESDQGQMIYTGARPALVQILAVTAPGENFTKTVVSGQPATSDTSYTSSASSTASSSHDSFRGYPSAY